MSVSEKLANEESELSRQEKIALLIVKYSGRVKRTRMQKLALLVNAMAEGKIPSSHGAWHLGGYSDDVDEGMAALEQEGVLAYEQGKGYCLTKVGDKLAKRVSEAEPHLDSIAQSFVHQLEGASDDRVTAITYKMFPQLARNSKISKSVQRKIENIPTIRKKAEDLEKLIEESG